MTQWVTHGGGSHWKKNPLNLHLGCRGFQDFAQGWRDFFEGNIWVFSCDMWHIDTYWYILFMTLIFCCILIPNWWSDDHIAGNHGKSTPRSQPLKLRGVGFRCPISISSMKPLQMLASYGCFLPLILKQHITARFFHWHDHDFPQFLLSAVFITGDSSHCFHKLLPSSSQLSQLI